MYIICLSNIDIFLSNTMTSVRLPEDVIAILRNIADTLYVSFPQRVEREEVRQILAFFLSGCGSECRGKVLVIIDNILNTVSRAEDAVELIFFVNELLHAFNTNNACGGIVRLRCDPKFQPILNAIKVAWSQSSSFPKIEPRTSTPSEPRTSTPSELRTAYAVLFSDLPPHDRGRLLWIFDHLFNSNSPGCDLLYEMANMKFEHMIKHAMTEQDMLEEANLRHAHVAEIAMLEEAYTRALSNFRQAYECKSKMVESHIGAINRERGRADAGFIEQLSAARQALGEVKELYKQQVTELKHAHRANVENLRGHGRNTTSQPTGRQTSTTSQPTGRQTSTTSQPTGRQPSTTSQPGVTSRPTDATAAQIRADEKFAREVLDEEFARLVAAGLV